MSETHAFRSVMVTGHRPHLMNPVQASWAESELQRLAVKLRDEHGCTEAISGMALGADTWWAKAALGAGLRLAAYIPCESQPSRWSAADRRTWEQLRVEATREVVVGTVPNARTFHARNDAMLQDADLVVAVWDPTVTTGGTAATVAKARRRGMDIIIVDLAEARTRIERGRR
ncbi:DUF1273 domain-containing protein (plasmid) [Citricoccus nitrophenolicus]